MNWRNFRARRFCGVVSVNLLLIMCLSLSCGEDDSPSRGSVQGASALAGHRPWIWSVTSGSTKVWMVGVLHVAGEREARLFSPYAQTVDKAAKIYFETVPGAWESLGSRSILNHRGVLGKSNSIKSQVSNETWRTIESLTLAHPEVFPDISRFRPWLACLEIEKAAYKRLDLRPEFGLETHLFDQAIRLARPIGGLETPAEQIDALASLNRKEQDAALNNILKEFAADSPILKKVRAAWIAGDQGAMQAALRLTPGQERTPLQRALLDERNRKWLKQVETFLAGREPVMIVVGVNHLIAPDIGLTDQLQQKGYGIERSR